MPRLVEEEIEPLAQAAVAAVGVLAVERPVLGVFGGGFRSPWFLGRFEAAIRRGGATAVEVVVPEHNALVGAFMLAAGVGVLGAGVGPEQVSSVIHEVDESADRLGTHLAERQTA
ncbi:MAG: hypothetical protein R2698_02085 [Microthrixaceae bacterium]